LPDDDKEPQKDRSMFSVTQIRGIQGAMAVLCSAADVELNGAHQRLVDAVQLPQREVSALRLVPVHIPSTNAIRGLLIRYRDEPAHVTHLLPPDNREAPSALRLALPEGERMPTWLGLHYVHMTRRKATATYYLYSGGLATFQDPDFEYSRLRRKNPDSEELAALLYTLNTPVTELPYPAGRKLSILEVFKKSGIRLVGDLVRRDAEDLKSRLNGMEWITVQSILRGLGLQPGTPIPQWKAPK
jgi:hypothetical protein